MAYRTPETQETTILETYAVSVAKGAEATGCLLGLAIVFLVMLVMRYAVETPPEIERVAWLFPTGVVVFTVPALWLMKKRRRSLVVERTRDTLTMRVRGEVELTFPIAVSGSQMQISIRGVPNYHVFLKMRGANGQGIFLKEERGAVHGRQEDWPEDLDKSYSATSYNVGGAGTLARIRAKVTELNATTATG